MTDTITINNLEISTIIGTYPFERLMKQKLLISTHFSLSEEQMALISETDDISHAIDYAKLSQSIIQFAEDSHCFLIESFAQKLSQHLLGTYSLNWIRLEITKPAAIKNAKGVTISIERQSEHVHA